MRDRERFRNASPRGEYERGRPTARRKMRDSPTKIGPSVANFEQRGQLFLRQHGRLRTGYAAGQRFLSRLYRGTGKRSFRKTGKRYYEFETSEEEKGQKGKRSHAG